MQRRYIESLIEKGLQKEQEELLAEVQKRLEMEFFQQKIREAGFREEVDNQKDGEADVDCDK